MSKIDKTLIGVVIGLLLFIITVIGMNTYEKVQMKAKNNLVKVDHPSCSFVSWVEKSFVDNNSKVKRIAGTKTPDGVYTRVYKNPKEFEFIYFIPHNLVKKYKVPKMKYLGSCRSKRKLYRIFFRVNKIRHRKRI